jgi:hypothetical protein
MFGNPLLDPTHLTLLQPKQNSLLCCVCHEQNSSFRYEVVFNKKDSSKIPLETLEVSQVLIEPIAEELEQLETTTTSNDYYNFPLRHPRHGHLKWSVWRTFSHALLNQAETYPDYPVHIPTITLKRLTSTTTTTTTTTNTKAAGTNCQKGKKPCRGHFFKRWNFF